MVYKILNNIKKFLPFFISFILGIAFWYYAKTDRVITMKRIYPIIIDTPEETIVKSISEDSITLEITGKIRLQQILKKIGPTIRIADKSIETQSIKINKNNVRFPAWIRIKDFNITEPESIIIQLDSLLVKRVKIITVKGVKFSPEEVTIRGPKSLIKDIEYLSPDSIPVGNITTITIASELIEVIPSTIKIRQ